MILEARPTRTDRPWDSEPDRVEFEAHGLPCLIRRTVEVGTLCGYVAVPISHPLWGRDMLDREVGELEVHGCVTYAESCAPEEKELHGRWWFGFDCAHAGDYMPMLDAMAKKLIPQVSGGVYRDIKYVKQQCAALAKQLAEIGAQGQATD